MGIKIYIWEQKSGNVGHGSMTLSDGTHISWWPAVDKSKSSMMRHMSSVEAGTADSYDEDKDLEGRHADYMYEIPSGKLDEGAIKSWWRQFKNKSNYHLLGNNCCTAVYEALKKGGATKYAAFPWNPISTPANLKEYAESLKNASSSTRHDEL